jgi:hypothetical protein
VVRRDMNAEAAILPMLVVCGRVDLIIARLLSCSKSRYLLHSPALSVSHGTIRYEKTILHV